MLWRAAHTILKRAPLLTRTKLSAAGPKAVVSAVCVASAAFTSTSYVGMTEADQQLTLSQAKGLLRETIIALDRPDVSQALEQLLLAAQEDRQLMIQLVMPFVNKVQLQVLKKNGFETSVVEFGRALEVHKTDSVVRQLLALLKSRMMPQLEECAARGQQRRDRERLGITLFDMEDNGDMCWTLPAEVLNW